MLVSLETLQLIHNKSQNSHISLRTLYKILEVPRILKHGNFSIPEIMKLIPSEKHELLGHYVKISSIRLRLFKEQFDLHKEVKCVCCGLTATHFTLEGDTNTTPHLNLYSNEALLTKDHIHPKSLGGTDTLNNLQVMCANCNVAKGNLMDIHYQ
jgi:hypothetical protein